jgi:hypothetical protein
MHLSVKDCPCTVLHLNFERFIMNLTNKAKILGASIVLTGVIYLPSASTSVTVIPVDTGITFYGVQTNIDKAFTNWFNSPVSPLMAGHTAFIEATGWKYSNPDIYTAVLSTISAVPLPGAVWMLLIGVIGMLGIQARSKKKS